MRALQGFVFLCDFAQVFVVFFDGFHFIFGHFLDIDESVARKFVRRNQFVELELDRQRILVLRLLDQEYHQKCDDGRAGVDDELPGFRKIENRAGARPNDDGGEREAKGGRTSGGFGGVGREIFERVAFVYFVVYHG